MELLSLNKAAIQNLSNRELINFCQFSKSDTELEGLEFLVHELSCRLGVAINEVQRLTPYGLRSVE